MPSAHHLIAFAITALVIIVVPGPSVLFIVGRALAVGRREAFLTMLGNTAGASVMLVAVALGLGALIAASAVVLTIVKLAGAAYLIYLGVHAVRTRKSLAAALAGEVKPGRARRVLRQGFLVGVTNAKTAVFFAAVLPQFVDKNAGPASLQILRPRADLHHHRALLGRSLGAGRRYCAGVVRQFAAPPRTRRRHGRTDDHRPRRQHRRHRFEGVGLPYAGPPGLRSAR